MDALVTMSVSPVLTVHHSGISHQSHEFIPSSKEHGSETQQTILTNPVTTSSTYTLTTDDSYTNSVTKIEAFSHEDTNTAACEATVFVGNNFSDVDIHTEVSNIISEVQSEKSGYESIVKSVVSSTECLTQQNCNMKKPAHVVKIKINPKCDNNISKVISAVTLNHDDVSSVYNFQTSSISNDKSSNTVYANNNNGMNDNETDGNERTNSNSKIIVNDNNKNTPMNTEPYIKINIGSNSSNSSSSECISDKLLQNNVNIISENAKDREIVYQKSCSNLPEPLNTTRSSGSCFYYNSPLNMMVISNGQSSPSETLDSGTCSDLDGTPPPLPKKNASNTVITRLSTTTTTSNNLASHSYHLHQRHDRTGSLTSSGAEVDSDDNESSISCDSLNSLEVPLSGTVKFRASRSLELGTVKQYRIDKGNSIKHNKDVIKNVTSINDATSINEYLDNSELNNSKKESFNHNKPSKKIPLNSGTVKLLKTSTMPIINSSDIINMKSSSTYPTDSILGRVNECTYEDRQRKQESNNNNVIVTIEGLPNDNPSIANYVYEDDRYYKFHINEREESLEKIDSNKEKIMENDDECFAGYKILEREAIRSARGTVRGVKNRVRAGIATFLQKPSSKNYKIKDAGKVVVYTTTMGIVRETYYRCVLVKQILRTHMVKYEERDLYMSAESQTELRDRIGCSAIQVPQLFIDGQYIGDADIVEQLNESGEIRLMLKPYKSLDACNTCKVCGGYCLLPCPVCNGSKKSMHRNDFTTEFVALKCMNCDEVGLVRCQHC